VLKEQGILRVPSAEEKEMLSVSEKGIIAPDRLIAALLTFAR